MASGRRVASGARSLVNDRSLHLENAQVLPVLMYGSDTMIWKEEDRCRVRAVHMYNLRVLLGIRRKDKIPNPRLRESCGVAKQVNERIDEGVLRWFGYVERLENDRIAKWVCEGECAGSRSVSRP